MAGNAYRCHPQLLPASSFTDSEAPLYPQVLAGSCASPSRPTSQGRLGAVGSPLFSGLLRHSFGSGGEMPEASPAPPQRCLTK